MVLLSSNTVDFPLGSLAPPISLPEPLSGETVSLASAAGANGTLVAVLSVHCPYVIHLHASLGALILDLAALGVNTVGISPNDVSRYPADAPRHMAALASGPLKGLRFLYDETQDVARALAAKCTPDFYLFDKEMKLAYRGRLDASSPGNGLQSDAKEMREAVKVMLGGGKVDAEDINPSMGCSIKWKV